MKISKVYKVTFGTVENNINDYPNEKSLVVIAQDVDNAILGAMEKLTKKDAKRLYPSEAEIIVELD